MKSKDFKNQAVCILSFWFFLMGMTVYSIARSKETNPVNGKERWLILLYDDADFKNGYDPLFDFAAEAYAHESLDILVLEDNIKSPAIIWQIGPNHEMIPQKYLGEIDMASSASLEYFLKFANKKFPGRRTILCIYDHGSGCWGACIDDTNFNKNTGSSYLLTLAGMREALEKTKPVDLVCFTAPCLMGSIEAAYELRHCTEAFVGSENLSGYICWFGCIRFICNTLKSRPEIGSHELAEEIVRFTATNYYGSSGFDLNYTMAAVRSDRLADAAKAISELSAAMLANSDEAFSLLNQALADIRVYYYSYADVIDLFEESMKRCQNPSLSDSFERAVDAVRQTILAEAHGKLLSGSNGLNIYFPLPPNISFNPLYGSSNIAFAKDAGWFEFLKAYRNSWLNAVPPDTRILIPRTSGLFPPEYGNEQLTPLCWFHLKQKNRDDK